MAEFVCTQIFGTTFEITSRYGGAELRRGVGSWEMAASDARDTDTRTCNRSEWAHLGWSGTQTGCPTSSPLSFAACPQAHRMR